MTRHRAASGTALNSDVWSRPDLLAQYANRDLRPVEVLILLRHRDELAGDVLELGAGAGRVTGYLAELARNVHGIDVSESMVAYGRRRYPRAGFELGDLRDLSGHCQGSLDAVLAPCNVLDVLDDAERRDVLGQVHRLLRPDGLFVLSSHNRGYVPHLPSPLGIVRWRQPTRVGVDLARMPRVLRNHCRARRFQRAEEDYALINDSAHEFSLLHYYISRDGQERQLGDHGYALLECRDLDGRLVSPGAMASHCVELHYVARRRG